MVRHLRDLLKGQALPVELLDVLLHRVAGRAGQFTDFLFAGALGVEAKNLADPAHKDCFIGHGRCGFVVQHLHSLPVKQPSAAFRQVVNFERNGVVNLERNAMLSIKRNQVVSLSGFSNQVTLYINFFPFKFVSYSIDEAN
jgi:hypothetical protein